MTSLLDILAPVIAVIALGYGLARAGVITPAGETGISNLVFFATTPALLFRAMATTALPTVPDLQVMAAYFGPCLLLYGCWAAGSAAALPLPGSLPWERASAIRCCWGSRSWIAPMGRLACACWC